MAEVVPLLFGEAYIAANQKRLEAYSRGRIRQKSDPRGLSMQWEAICHFDARDRLDSLAMPTLVLHGTDDRLTPVRAAQALAGGLGNGRLHLFEGLGHSPQVEDWRAFNHQILEFLGS